MSSLYLCSECSSSFASHEQLCQHTAEKHDVAVDVVEDEEADNCTEIDMKMEDDPISDTESTVSRSLKNPAGGYECEECHEMFTVKRELATHQRIHSGEMPHMCTQCGKEFGTRQLLKKHWMWHTGQRSHVCPHCNKAFFQKGHLTQHLMIHSGGRPHECQQCHKTFIFKFDLNRHMKIHQERGYSCQQCGRSFLKQVMLDEHHLKCKGKPSSPSRSSLSSGTSATSAFNPVLAADHIAKMAQRLREQQQQNSAFTSLLIEQNKQNNNNLIPPPLFCVICKSSFTNQSAFAIHTYMHHLTTVPPPVLDTTVAALGSNSTVVGPGAILGSGNGSDVDPATDTSCASSPQKASPLQLESCLESSQSSVSPSSSSTTSGRISEPGCKDCNGSWLKIQELETKIDKKNEEFDTYRHMVKMIVSSVSTILSQSNPDQNNFLINHANNIFKQLQNSL